MRYYHYTGRAVLRTRQCSRRRPGQTRPPMQDLPDERRRAPRYGMEARVTIHKASGEIVSATSVNISSSGVLLKVSPDGFKIGEEVTIELDLPNEPEKALAVWGVGRVVRVDSEGSAIQLDAGSFHNLQIRGGRHAGDD